MTKQEALKKLEAIEREAEEASRTDQPDRAICYLMAYGYFVARVGTLIRDIFTDRPA